MAGADCHSGPRAELPRGARWTPYKNARCASSTARTQALCQGRIWPGTTLYATACEDDVILGFMNRMLRGSHPHAAAGQAGSEAFAAAVQDRSTTRSSTTS